MEKYVQDVIKNKKNMSKKDWNKKKHEINKYIKTEIMWFDTHDPQDLYEYEYRALKPIIDLWSKVEYSKVMRKWYKKYYDYYDYLVELEW